MNIKFIFDFHLSKNTIIVFRPRKSLIVQNLRFSPTYANQPYKSHLAFEDVSDAPDVRVQFPGAYGKMGTWADRMRFYEERVIAASASIYGMATLRCVPYTVSYSLFL